MHAHRMTQRSAASIGAASTFASTGNRASAGESTPPHPTAVRNSATRTTPRTSPLYADSAPVAQPDHAVLAPAPRDRRDLHIHIAPKILAIIASKRPCRLLSPVRSS